MKNKKQKLERTNIFLSAEEKEFYIAVAEKNEQSLSWILRKVLGNYFEYCNKNKIKNGSTKEVNKTLEQIKTSTSYNENLKNAIDIFEENQFEENEISVEKKDEWNKFLNKNGDK